jgi:methionyl-tRNA formyltransferase
VKIIFMGTPDFAVPTLMTLLNSDHQVTAIFSQKPKPKGRGMEVTISPIHMIANQYQLPIHSPTSLRNQEAFELINSIEADIIVVAAYGFIIPKNILESKKYGCINLHPSKLPRFRGAAPLQHTIIEGDNESSICVMQMDEGMDTGPILLEKHFELPKRPKLKWLHDYTSVEGAKIVLEVINNITNITPIKQNIVGVKYAPKLSKKHAFINWLDSANKIDAQIRGYAAWPGSFARSGDNIFKIIEAEPAELPSDTQADLPPGSIFELHKNLHVSCGIGLSDKLLGRVSSVALKILLIQPENKKPISGIDFINGYKIKQFQNAAQNFSKSF